MPPSNGVCASDAFLRLLATTTGVVVGAKPVELATERVYAQDRLELKGFESRFEASRTTRRPTSDADLGWSDEAPEIVRRLRLGSNDVSGPEVLYPLFRTLRLKRLGLTHIDAGLAVLEGLEELNVSGNSLSRIENIPGRVRVLHACNNAVVSVIPGEAAAGLVHLGLAYNHLAAVSPWSRRGGFPSLLSLDLSFNHLCELTSTLSALGELPKLAHLYLAGNPVALLPSFRNRVIAALPRLLVLDDVAVDGDSSQQQDNAVATGVAGDVGGENVDDDASVVRISIRLGALTGMRPTPVSCQPAEGEDSNESKKDEEDTTVEDGVDPNEDAGNVVAVQRRESYFQVEVNLPPLVSGARTEVQRFLQRSSSETDECDSPSEPGVLDFSSFNEEFSFEPSVAARDTIEQDGLEIKVIEVVRIFEKHAEEVATENEGEAESGSDGVQTQDVDVLVSEVETVVGTGSVSLISFFEAEANGFGRLERTCVLETSAGAGKREKCELWSCVALNEATHETVPAGGFEQEDERS